MIAERGAQRGNRSTLLVYGASGGVGSAAVQLAMVRSARIIGTKSLETADPEFRAAIICYAEWGTGLTMRNSQPGAQTVAHAPVARWGWGVAQPYEPPADGS